MNEAEYTATRVSAQPPNEQNGPQHVSGPALALLCNCARESFDAKTLRDLSIRFARIADEKDGGV